MALTAPTQVRAMDPYSDNRFSNTINLLSRIYTGGNKVILFPESSFVLSRIDGTTLGISAGFAVKDDVMIHIDEDFELPFDDAEYYLDTTGGLDIAGWYYVVMEYVWKRSLPAPQAMYKIIKDDDVYDLYADSVIFLGAVKVYDSGSSVFIIDTGASDISPTHPHDPTNIYRPYANALVAYVDGGEDA